MGQEPGNKGNAPEGKPRAPRQYRIYFLDAAEDENSVVPFEARTDAEAYTVAKNHAGTRSFELWSQERLVIRRVAGEGA